MQVVEGVHRIDEASDNPAHSNVYLVINGRELAVIDTGTPGNAGKIVDHIQRLGFQLSDVKHIILTHHHRDHVGSASELHSLTNAPIAAHADDADFISGKRSPPLPGGRPRPAMPLDPVPVDIVLHDGDHIAGLTVYHAPGHTPGSMMLLDEKRGVLFAGDTLRFDGKSVSSAPEEFTLDMARMRASIAMASKLRFSVMLPGHGLPLTANASDEVRKLLSRP